MLDIFHVPLWIHSLSLLKEADYCGLHQWVPLPFNFRLGLTNGRNGQKIRDPEISVFIHWFYLYQLAEFACVPLPKVELLTGSPFL